MNLGFRISDKMITILLRRFDRTGKGEVRFDDFIQLCVIVRVSFTSISFVEFHIILEQVYYKLSLIHI